MRNGDGWGAMVWKRLGLVGSGGGNPSRASLAGLYRRSPLLAFTLLVGMFGLAGIPPTAGFAGKWFLFSAAIERDLFWLVLIGALNATVSLYYYLLVIKEAYLTPPVDESPIAVSFATTVAATRETGMSSRARVGQSRDVGRGASRRAHDGIIGERGGASSAGQRRRKQTSIGA